MGSIGGGAIALLLALVLLVPHDGPATDTAAAASDGKQGDQLALPTGDASGITAGHSPPADALTSNHATTNRATSSAAPHSSPGAASNSSALPLPSAEPSGLPDVPLPSDEAAPTSPGLPEPSLPVPSLPIPTLSLPPPSSWSGFPGH